MAVVQGIVTLRLEALGAVFRVISGGRGAARRYRAYCSICLAAQAAAAP